MSVHNHDCPATGWGACACEYRVLDQQTVAKAVQALRDARPKPTTWYGPRWATDHVQSHDFCGDCADCHRAWGAMHR